MIADAISFATPVLGCEFSISGLIKPLQSIASTLGGVLVGVRVARLEGAYVVRDVAGQPLTTELIADTAERIAEIRASEEGREGVRSFLEKRKPNWLGQ